uniref:Uncharacterized protein n=1 Tax=Magallana gigas TaxID=29159 RepID=A0A8W8MIP9_MAGGI
MEEEISSGSSSPVRRPGLRQIAERLESDTSSTSSPVRRGRGRGRGRGRPRGSGGRRADTQERRRHRGDEAADALSERERILETRIEGMTDEERRDLLLKAVCLWS